jgi:hypothetical protein
MINEKDGICPKIDILKFEYIHKHNKQFMTSSKTQINYYHLSMAKINTYQYNIIPPRLVWH